MNEIDLEGNVLRLQNLQAKKEIREDVKPKEKQPVREQSNAGSSKVENANKSSEVSKTTTTEPKDAAPNDNGVLEPFKVCLPLSLTAEADKCSSKPSIQLY